MHLCEDDDWHWGKGGFPDGDVKDGTDDGDDKENDEDDDGELLKIGRAPGEVDFGLTPFTCTHHSLVHILAHSQR